MAAPFETPIVCPLLIGRERQLDLLSRLVEQARAGQGHTALIAGEAGIGKSRLVAELKPAAIAQGLTILQGRCFEPDRVLPYAPLPAAELAGWARSPRGCGHPGGAFRSVRQTVA
jgi:predicted ATPase